MSFKLVSLLIKLIFKWGFSFSKISLSKVVKMEQSKYEPQHDKTNKVTERPAKTQISLGICPVWSESSLCAQSVAKDPSFLHADSEDWSDWADAQADLSLRWAHTHFVGFVMSWLSSISINTRRQDIRIMDYSLSFVFQMRAELIQHGPTKGGLPAPGASATDLQSNMTGLDYCMHLKYKS